MAGVAGEEGMESYVNLNEEGRVAFRKKVVDAALSGEEFTSISKRFGLMKRDIKYWVRLHRKEEREKQASRKEKGVKTEAEHKSSVTSEKSGIRRYKTKERAELRKKAVDAVAAGEPLKEVAKRFGVSKQSVYYWVQNVSGGGVKDLRPKETIRVKKRTDDYKSPEHIYLRFDTQGIQKPICSDRFSAEQYAKKYEGLIVALPEREARIWDGRFIENVGIVLSFVYVPVVTREGKIVAKPKEPIAPKHAPRVGVIKE